MIYMILEDPLHPQADENIENNIEKHINSEKFKKLISVKIRRE